ncbi:MAG: type VI secretion system lipoprotein TssJ [Acidisphaera sp.]|nr:type VI secretion system lipoprotein TssJ [Acidisphaera sp.]
MKRRQVLLLGALAAARCAPPPPPPPPVLTLTINAGPDINPDAAGHPASVAVRMFNLNATAKFERADVFALTDRERDTLGDDDAGSEEFVLSPGENRTITRELKKGVQFIGIAVLFRDIDHATWRAIAPVAANGPSKLTLKLAKITASLAPS